MYDVYMTSTTTSPTVTCCYCDFGTVWGGSSNAPRRRCLICLGTGRIAPVTCHLCGDPILDGQDRKRGVKSIMSHKDC